MKNFYTNLLSQAQRLYRHNRQGSYKTKERYFEAYKRFLKFVGDTYNLQKLQSISGKHLSAYVGYIQDKFISEGKTEHEAKLVVSKLFGHEREDVTRIYLASLFDGENCR